MTVWCNRTFKRSHFEKIWITAFALESKMHFKIQMTWRSFPHQTTVTQETSGGQCCWAKTRTPSVNDFTACVPSPLHTKSSIFPSSSAMDHVTTEEGQEKNAVMFASSTDVGARRIWFSINNIPTVIMARVDTCTICVLSKVDAFVRSGKRFSARSFF